MIKEFVEIMAQLFNRDIACVEQVKKNFPELNYPMPPEDVSKYIKDAFVDEGIEPVLARIHDVDIEEDNIKIPKGSFDFFFKFKDVKVKRKKIFRLGDYYLRVLSTGFDKYIFVFYTRVKQYSGRTYTFNYRFIRAQHPHISNGTACFSAMEKGIISSITNYNLGGFLFQIKNFLQSWNYRSPHHMPEKFDIKSTPILKDVNNIIYLTECSTDSYNNQATHFTFNRYLENTLNSKEFMLPSARCKDYITEPFSRLCYELSMKRVSSRDCISFRSIRYINRFLTNFYLYLKENLTLEEPFEDIDYLYLTFEIFNIVETKAMAILNGNNVEWTDELQNLLVSMNKFKERECKYYINKKYNNYSDYYTYYLAESTNEIETTDYFNFINLLEKLKDMKRTTVDSYISEYHKTKAIFNLLSELIQLDVFKSDIKHCMHELYAVDVTVENKECKLTEYTNQFNESKIILSKYMLNYKLDYHKKQIRRLTSGNENNVQIENLNL